MAEIDPVILELRAELGKYRADLKSTTSQVNALLGKQERDVQRLEKQMTKSSTAISGALRNIGASLGTYFSGRELVGLIDNFTRLQNALRVAGLEGSDLNQVQTQLLALSSKYGVSVNELADLFGKATQAGSGLGASQQQLLQITEASAQALKITGTSATQAQGALLGLTQALSSGIVRAEEFNQINEGGLRPLLQVAANAEKYGGSVAKLRMAVVDGKVTSQEFYQAILAGSAELEGKASKATLTLAGAFASLTSALTVYVGQSAQANGVTAALSGGMQLLAENLDKIIPALSVIATIFAGRFLAGALVGGAALRTLAAYASIATTSLAGTALAAQGAGAALLRAFGGPVGLAITALVLGIGYLVAETNAASDAAKEAELQAIRTASAQDAEKRATELLAKAKGAEKTAQIEATKASRDRAAQALQTAKALQAEAKAALVAARAQARQTFEKSAGDTSFLATVGRALGGAGGSGPTITPGTAQANNLDRRANAAQVELDRANKAIAELEGQVDGLTAAIGDGANAPKLAPTSVGDTGKKTKTPKGQKDRTEELAARAAQDLYQLQIEELRAKSQITNDIDERADLERQILAMERDAREADIAAAVKSGDLTAEQSAAQREILNTLYGKRDAENSDGDILVQATKSLYGIAIERDRRMQAERDRADLAETEYRAQSDALRDQYDLAQTLDERRSIALQILDAEDAYLKSKLESVIANKDLTKAVQDQAQIELDALNASAPDRRKLVEKANQGALDRYLDDTADPKARAEEAAVRELQSVRDGLAEGLAEQLGIKNQFIKDRLSIFLDEVLFRPIAEALRSRQGGGGGFFGGLLKLGASLLGGGGFTGDGAPGGAGGMDLRGFRAGGGPVSAGGLYRINENATPGNPEYFRPAHSGTVIPLGQVNARAASSAPQIKVVSAPQFDLRGAVMTPQLYADMERISRANAAQAGAAAYQRSMKDAPGALASAQRYGPR